MENELMIVTPEQLTPAIVRERICPEATDQEIFLFLQIAKACKLNPFLNQIYLVKYGTSKAQILTSYNVYLQRAERSGAYAGLETSTVGSVGGGDLKAVVKVFRKDWEKPLVHEVYYEEYVQYGKDQKTGEKFVNKFWKEKPRTMITKVAISQAFRLAFPLDFEGMPYTQDEMPHEVIEIAGKPEVQMPQAKTVEILKNGKIEIDVTAPSVPKAESKVSMGLKSEKMLPSEVLQSKPAMVEATDSPKAELESLERVITAEEGTNLLKMACKNGYTKKDVTEYIQTLGYPNYKSLTLWDMPTVILRFEINKAEYEKRKNEK